MYISVLKTYVLTLKMSLAPTGLEAPLIMLRKEIVLVLTLSVGVIAGNGRHGFESVFLGSCSFFD